MSLCPTFVCSCISPLITGAEDKVWAPKRCGLEEQFLGQTKFVRNGLRTGWAGGMIFGQTKFVRNGLRTGLYRERRARALLSLYMSHVSCV
jgi:hypothetical protein